MTDERAEYPESVDVLRYETPTGSSYRSVPAGDGEPIVVAHADEFQRQVWIRRITVAGAAIAAIFVSALFRRVLLGAAVAAILAGSLWTFDLDRDGSVPTLVDEGIRRDRASSTYDIDVHTADPWSGGE
ncbi:hypothetical protein [Natrinema marinum]|uniref:hypothetical protein n=1 Tax=Natrinema marinum TaxID=2961598 RepID=UPI0020C84FB2|nr:hypothetical protein [Natrinema marinum]